jgi:hypothetical protein
MGGSKQLLYVGVAMNRVLYDTGIEKTIEYALQTIGSTAIQVIKYDYEFNTNLIDVCAQFLEETKNSNYRVFITESSDTIVQSDHYFNQQQKKHVLCFATSASANSIQKLLTQNALTYGYFNQDIIKSFYLYFKTYNVRQSLLLYDPLTSYRLYQTDLIEQFQTQLLNIPYQIVSLSDIDTVTSFLPNTAIFMICETIHLQNYVTPSFLQKIGPNSYIMLPDIAEDAPDIFGNIPTFTPYFWPANFTKTSIQVYQNVNIQYATFQIYPMYQMIYTLAKLSLSPLFFKNPFTIQEYISFNAFSSIPVPYISGESLSIAQRGTLYSYYANVFTKNVFFQNFNDLYYKNTLGGSPHTRQSTSLFAKVGFIPWFVSKINTQYNNPLYFYQSYCDLFLVKNSGDTAYYDKETGTLLSEYDNYNQNVFVYQYNTENYFTLLEYVLSKKLVNRTMSIYIKKIYVPC